MRNKIIKTIYYFFLFSILIGSDNNYKKIDYQYKIKKYDALRVYFDCSLGKLSIKPGNNKYIIVGTIKYNSELSIPSVSLNDKNNIAKLDINISPNKNINSQNSKSLLGTLVEEGNDNYLINFQMPTKIATDYNLNFGLGKVNLDFSGIRVTQLTMDCGMSDVNMINNKQNIIPCESIKINIGVSDFNSVGLGNFNAEKYTFDVGMGTADIDMTGSLNKDCSLSIDVSVGSLELILPKNKNIELIVKKNMFSSVDIKGLLSSGNGKYISRENHKRWSTIKAEIAVGIGSIDVSIN